MEAVGAMLQPVFAQKRPTMKISFLTQATSLLKPGMASAGYGL
jgi:hypothetical protein